MTTTNLDAERAAFEAWFGRPLMNPAYPQHYNGKHARRTWAAWQAARDAQPVSPYFEEYEACAKRVNELMDENDTLRAAQPEPVEATGGAMAELLAAADAAVERWHSKDWKQPHTAEFINRLAAAVGALKFAPAPVASEPAPSALRLIQDEKQADTEPASAPGEAINRRLLEAASVYAHNHLRDELADPRDCINSDTQWFEVCELFAAIDAARQAAPAQGEGN